MQNKTYITGDIHGKHDINKLNSKNFPKGKTLSKDDYVIILGDFGLPWSASGNKSDDYWLSWLKNKPWTTLFIDGNHENHSMLQELKIINKFNGKVGYVNDSVYHLRRGEVYIINELKFFCMGGAKSTDKENRKEWISWWSDEIPSFSEMEYGLQNISNNDYRIDVILSHTAPTTVIRNFLFKFKLREYEDRMKDATTMYLDEIYSLTVFKKWYCGHFHKNAKINNIHFLYDDIIEVGI